MKKYILMIISLLEIGCQNSPHGTEPYDAGGNINEAKIILIGEEHGVDWIYDLEFTTWKKYYDEGFRHLFVEASYFDGEYLNLWIQSDKDDLYEALFLDKKGTPAYNQSSYEFYKKIKRECPLTIFHGTDVGHQYDTTGERFLEYLTENNLQSSEQYILALEAIEQGKNFYKDDSWEYRENTMTQNFIREYDRLKNERIMGIYGGAHTNYNNQACYGDYPCMAKQLRSYYGDIIYFENYKE
ncbi:MAG: hypothetical protein LBP43_03290 [Treponema sp.]|jgi:hypothetical protein|nr:hypothetical protein [Treponema sp.]